MQPSDLTIEVTDVTLARRGLILPEYWTDIKTASILRAVGSWSMSLPVELPEAQLLAQPGSGILITGPDGELFSGPTSQPKENASQTDPTGTITFTGSDCNQILNDALAYPTPSIGDVAAQADAYDVRTAPAETAIRSLVDANIGPSAPAARRGGFAQLLTLAPDQGRGATTTISSRFDNLLDQCATAAKTAGLGFRIVRDGNGLQLVIFTPQDKTDTIRLDIANGRLSSYEYAVTAPTLTRAIVAGQGDGVARTFLEQSNSDSLAAEAAWGRRIEQFKDERNTNDPTELQQAGDDALAAGGYTGTSLKLTPTDDETMRYQRDWFLGDYIAAVVRDLTIPQVVTQVGMAISKDGVLIGAQVGDLDSTDLQNLAVARRIARLETRK